MWLCTAQNVVNIPAIFSYTDEWICSKMPQNEERNITSGSSNRIVHLRKVLTTNFSIFSSFCRRWSWLPLHNNGFSFPESLRHLSSRQKIGWPCQNPKKPHPKSKVSSLSDFFITLKHTYCMHHFGSTSKLRQLFRKFRFWPQIIFNPFQDSSSQKGSLKFTFERWGDATKNCTVSRLKARSSFLYPSTMCLLDFWTRKSELSLLLWR